MVFFSVSAVEKEFKLDCSVCNSGFHSIIQNDFAKNAYTTLHIKMNETSNLCFSFVF